MKEASEKSRILSHVERQGEALPIRADGGLPRRAGEEALTPDEKLMVQIYRMAMESGNPMKTISLKAAAQRTGLKEIALKNIVKHLAQANFVKKMGDEHLSLTEQGCRFIPLVIQESVLASLGSRSL